MDDNLENNPQKISENKKNENAIKHNPSDKPKDGTTSSAKSKEVEKNSSKIDNKQLESKDPLPSNANKKVEHDKKSDDSQVDKKSKLSVKANTSNVLKKDMLW